jgi:hypothetical protein
LSTFSVFCFWFRPFLNNWVKRHRKCRQKFHRKLEFARLYLAGNDDRERDRCTIFCVSKRAKPKSVCGRESVGGKTNIYFCSIARHGGSIVYILYTLGNVLHTRSYRLGSYRCFFFPSVCCLSVNEALKRPPPLYNHIFPCCFSFLLFPPNGQITSGHIAHNWGNAVRQTHLYF